MAEEYGKIPSDKESQGLLLQGVAASEVIDSSGESISIKGVDLSQFEEDAGILCCYEHYAGDKSSKDDAIEGEGALVGKVVYLKRILSHEDVDGEDQEKYWKKCAKQPFLFCIVRLFDSSGHENAKAIAAHIRDNAKHGEPIGIRFSIEGSTLSKDGNRITQSIFRRLALTNKPANKTAVSDLLYDPQGGKLDKSDQDPLFRRIGGSQEIECNPVLEKEVVEVQDPSLSLLGHASALHILAKATTAGSCDAAPSTLTGGAALQREELMGKHRNQLLAMVRDWGNRPFNKAEFGAFVKAQLPGLSEDFVNHFMNVAEDWHLRKASLLKAEGEPKTPIQEPSGEPKEFKLQSRTPESSKIPYKGSGEVYQLKGKNGLYSNGPKGEPNLVRGSVWNHAKQKSFLAPVDKNLKKAYFDENTGVLKTHFGSFKAQAIPHQQSPEDAKAFDELLNHPNLQKVMDAAIPNWYKVHQLAGKRELPEEIPMHAAIFSIMSANNQVPINELQFSRMIDAMNKTGLDPRKPGFEAILPEMKASDSPTKLPEHSREHFKGNPSMFVGGITSGVQKDLFGEPVKPKKAKNDTSRAIGEIQSTAPFMEERFIPKLAEYHKVHQKVIDAFKKHGNSMIDLGGALKDLVLGLGVKTGLFAAGLAGGGSSPVPDTHHVRSKFGLHIDKDAATIKKIKEQMWAPENYDTIMRPYARWFAKNSPAVKHMLSNPKFAHMFKGHEEDATFPGFWLDWQTIAPWEKRKGLPSSSKTGEATHKPVWDAFNKFIKSEKQEKLDPTLPMRTALLHQKYLENYGEVPASLLYYAYIAPKLLEAAEARKKTESGLDFLSKSDVFLAKSREIESKLIELRKTVREAVEGAQVEMPEVHRVDIKSGDKTHPAGRYMIHDGKLSHLEDYHGILSSVLPEGPLDADAIAHLHGLKLSPNFVVRQHEPKESEEPKEVREALPQVQVSDALPQPQRAPIFDYYRPGLAKPHSVEFGPNGAALDGQKLSHQELGLMLENARSGLATIKYRKAEIPLKKAEMEPSEALRNIRELTSKGLLHPDIERALTRHIYGDPMVEGVGNKYSFNEFRGKNRPGVWASIDANNFKKINDSYGHEAGDKAIQALGGAFRDAGAKVGTGKVFRSGGDEFAAWFPSHEEASQFIGHAKKHVDALPPVAGVHKHSFSFGLGSDYTGADAALREAKKQKLDPISGQLKHSPGNTPHFGHSLVPGKEGPMPSEAEGPSQKILPVKATPQFSASA